MMKEILVQLRISLVAVLSLAVLLCGVYPLLVWAVGQALFPQRGRRVPRPDRGILLPDHP